MGNILWSKTTLEVAVAELIASCHIRKADGEVCLTLILISQLLTFSFGEFEIYASLLKVGD